MSVKSSFKTIFSGTKSAQSADRPRWRKKTLSFEEALDQLKRLTGSSTECVAFRTLGRCRKQIKLIDSHHGFIARLNDRHITEEKTAVGLIALMLCPEHWAETAFNYSLYLDWLNARVLKPDNQYYEDIVVEYESVIAVEDMETSLQEDTSVAADVELVESHSVSSLDTKQRPFTPDSERSYNSSIVNSTRSADIPITVEPESTTEADQATPWTQSTSEEISTTDNDIVSEPSDDDQRSDCSSPADDSWTPANIDLDGTRAVTSLQSYASLEFGVAKLEIMHRENLQCIAMTTDGWRCSELIPGRSVEQARDTLTSTMMPDTNQLEDIARGVLCSGHAIRLPEIYADSWSVFIRQRLPTEEAISRFQFTSEDQEVQWAPGGVKAESDTRRSGGVQTDFGNSQKAQSDFPVGGFQTAFGNKHSAKFDFSFGAVRTDFGSYQKAKCDSSFGGVRTGFSSNHTANSDFPFGGVQTDFGSNQKAQSDFSFGIVRTDFDSNQKER
jgi:hypothetical protein